MGLGANDADARDVATDPVLLRREDVRRHFSVDRIQFLEAAEIVRCQSVLGHGQEYGFWETPPALIGRRLKANEQSFSFRRRITNFLPKDLPATTRLDALLDEGVLWLSRYSLLISLGPSALLIRKHKNLDASTIVKILHLWIPKIVAYGVVRRLEDVRDVGQGFACHLNADDLHALRLNRHIGAELGRLAMLCKKGLWPDAPPEYELAAITNPKGAALTPPCEAVTSPFPPIPDAYMVEMGPRVLWLVQDLGPNLVALAEDLPRLLSGIGLKSRAFPARLRRYLADKVWRDREERPITVTPFPFKIGSRQGEHLGTVVNEYEWPPRTWQQVQAVLVSLQSAHLWIVLLATAGRLQEVLTLPRRCVEWARDGEPYLDGKSFKLSCNLAGEDRQWPAPSVLVETLAQQVRLVTACENVLWERDMRREDGGLLVEGHHLWASLGTGGNTGADRQLVEVNHALQVLAARLGMPPRPSGKNLHAHRFRKTIARLAALAIVDSPRVLMQLFGHRDIAMTLHYILSDKALQVEIEQVARELRIMRCQDVVESLHAALHDPEALVFGGYGGGAVAQINQAVVVHERALHRQGREWDAGSAYELAVILTLNGQYFRVVKPGVLCTRLTTELNPCICGSDCINRIEDKTARRDVLHLIPVLLAQGERALEENQLMVVASVVDQLEDELARFEDVRAAWYEHATLMRLRAAVNAA